jgi:GT2 family glycosyltransferase
MTTRNISAVTVTYFSDLSLLRPLLGSIQDAAKAVYQEYGYCLDYYIVDNSRNENYFWALEVLCVEVFDTDTFRLHMIRAPSNLGYSGGNNLLLDQLASDYHLVINPDVTLGVDSLCKAVDYLQQHQDVALLTPKVVNGRPVQHVVKVYPDCLTLLLRYLDSPRLNRLFAVRLARYQCSHLADEPCSVDLAGGCFLCIRTSLFKELRGFDDYFFMYFEDYDLSIRLAEKGKIVYLPTVEITHTGGYVGKKDSKHHFFFVVSALKFFSRYGFRLW